MSAVSSAAGSGVVLGIVLVFLVQQFGFLGLTDLLVSLLYFALVAALCGIICGFAASVVARRARDRAAQAAK